MVAFEEYFAKCASRSPEDRLLHERLARGTGYARSVMEQLLLEVCEADAALNSPMTPWLPDDADREGCLLLNHPRM